MSSTSSLATAYSASTYAHRASASALTTRWSTLHPTLCHQDLSYLALQATILAFLIRYICSSSLLTAVYELIDETKLPICPHFSMLENLLHTSVLKKRHYFGAEM
jgi:hypothetical protein